MYNIPFHTSTRAFMFRADELGCTTFKWLSSQERHLFTVCRTRTGLVGLKTESKEKIKCWLGNSIRHCGRFLTALTDRLENWSQTLVQQLRLGYCPLTGCNSGYLLAGILTRHSTLRRQLYTMRLTDSPLCRRCGEQKDTSAHILCECEVLETLRRTYLDSIF